MYEGRTRGKRIRYTFSDDDETSDAPSNRRSARQSGLSTPAEPAGPTYSASGRQVRPPPTGLYGDSLTVPNGNNGRHAGGQDGADAIGEQNGASETRTRSGRTSGRSSGRPTQPVAHRKHIDGYNDLDEMDVESDAVSSENSWDGGGDDDEVVVAQDVSEEEDDEMSEDDDFDDEGPPPKSLVNVCEKFSLMTRYASSNFSRETSSISLIEACVFSIDSSKSRRCVSRNP